LTPISRIRSFPSFNSPSRHPLRFQRPRRRRARSAADQIGVFGKSLAHSTPSPNQPHAILGISANMSKEYLLKQLEAGKNEEGLRQVLNSAQELKRGDRRSRHSLDQQHSGTSSASAAPDQRTRGAIQPATPKGKTPLLSRTPATRRNRQSVQPTRPKTAKGKTPKGKTLQGKTGKTLLPPSEPGTPGPETEEQQKPSAPTTNLKSSLTSKRQPPNIALSSRSSSPDIRLMASQRNRPARGGPRGGTNDLTEEKDLWDQIRPLLASINKAEARAAEVNKEIFEDEVQKKEKLNAGLSMFHPFRSTWCFPSQSGLTRARTFHRRNRSSINSISRPSAKCRTSKVQSHR
jgi:hypothetical protein